VAVGGAVAQIISAMRRTLIGIISIDGIDQVMYFSYSTHIDTRLIDSRMMSKLTN